MHVPLLVAWTHTEQAGLEPVYHGGETKHLRKRLQILEPYHASSMIFTVYQALKAVNFLKIRGCSGFAGAGKISEAKVPAISQIEPA
jgi:hypothetical protein